MLSMGVPVLRNMMSICEPWSGRSGRDVLAPAAVAAAAAGGGKAATGVLLLLLEALLLEGGEVEEKENIARMIFIRAASLVILPLSVARSGA